MQFLALATDYDGTLAYSGKVRDSTIEALESLRASGRHLILVTGRQLEELLETFSRPDLFEWIVAENGALLYCPRTRETRLLADAVPAGFAETLRERGIQNLGVGRSIVATWQPHECTVLGVLRDLGLDRQIIFNKDAVMVLPGGINKASGLTCALEAMKVSHHNVVAVGDAENDLPMLTQCECGVAVANALDSVKAQSHLVTQGARGSGVEELIHALVEDDLEQLLEATQRPGVLLGTTRSEPPRAIYIPGLGHSVLVAGPSGSGKSTAITGFLERLAKAAYQFCIFDPEGDYESFEPAINLGNPGYVPSAEDVLRLLERMHSTVVNLLGVSVDARPQVATEILRKLDELRCSKGRPHWFVIDEAHHIFPSDAPDQRTVLVAPPETSLMITVHPDHVRKEALETVDIVIAIGTEPDKTIRSFCATVGVPEPKLDAVELSRGEVLVWFRRRPGDLFVVAAEPGVTEHKRHIRKYADGDLGPGSFVFRGPASHMHLIAQNLNTFTRMAEGIDDETWNHHLHSGDLTEWFRWIVKDRELADEVQTIAESDGSPQETKASVIAAVCQRYTLPS